jgi:tetraacyldisaccharide 4'-kinase
MEIIGKILLSPLALIYGMVVSMRRLLYRTGLMRSSRFDVPTISVGNLNTGGSGKTPHIEYLIRLLEPYINVSVLSRGYRRKTEGFRMVEADNTVIEVGDEPLQFKLKYPSVPVAVGEKRAYAIPQLLYRHSQLQAILLDDAFQHLAVTPYLNILITEFHNPFTKDYLLPAGDLRDWRSSYRHADIIVVSKCPEDLTEAERKAFIEDINPYPSQTVYFSYFDYGTPYKLFNPAQYVELDSETEVLLVCGIAKPQYLTDYISRHAKSVQTMAFEDHRLFTNYDVAQFKRVYEGMKSPKKVIITTEKDAVRLALHKSYILDNQLPIYVMPIEVDFLFDQKGAFDTAIKDKLLAFKA